MHEQRPVILFDNQCKLCTRFKQALELMNGEKKVYFLPLHEVQVTSIHPDLNEEECSEFVHLIDENNQVHKGSEVIEYLIRFYPQVKKISWLLEYESAKKAVESFHNVIHKFKHSKFNTCHECQKK
jgi:predicted DCC family thiol-disulfide oxidoreductase YuxK